MKCNKCGHTLPADSEFCQYCGNKILVKKPNVANTSNATAKSTNSQKSTCERNLNLVKFSIPAMIISFIMLVICLNIKSISSGTELLYFIPLALILINIALVFFNYKKNNDSSIYNNIILLLSVVSIIPFFTEDIWNDGDYKEEIMVMLVITILLFIYNLIIQLYFAIKVNIKKYHTTASYKMKCYEKLDRMNNLKEKGIITEEDFAQLKKQLLEKTINN